MTRSGTNEYQQCAEFQCAEFHMIIPSDAVIMSELNSIPKTAFVRHQ